MRAEDEEELCRACMHSFQTVHDVRCHCKAVSMKKTNVLIVSDLYVIKDNFSNLLGCETPKKNR